MTITNSGPEPVAVIGSSCRFPGGLSSPSKLWEFLRKPNDLLSDIPLSSFNPRGFYHANAEHHGCSNVTKSYMLDEDRRVFDYSFFNINPKEAESMDPQHRILLETVYEGIESAGYSIQRLKGSGTAVFVGQMTADYYDILARDFESIPQYMATGTSRCLTSNRVSYFFDWKGPSVTIDTACSSSLVAVHQAIQELRHGGSKLAVAAGVNLILGPETYIHESKLHMLSPTGRCRMWDADANGYARGEGFAAVVLKPISQAIADGDHIECVIRETGVNQDGRTPGISMPSASSQAALIRSTYQRCGLDCSVKEDRCHYFEAHGTGTPAGDPVEAEAVRNAFFDKSQKSDSINDDSESLASHVLYVGSIKTAIGHLEGAAGVAALLKASLAVQHGIIPPNMHFHRLNPKIQPFYHHLHVPTKVIQWPTLPKGVPRRVSVNSFGFGGTNCHAIIESWEPTENMMLTGSSCLKVTSQIPCGPFNVSANSVSALSGAVAALSDTLKTTEKDISLADLAYTLQMRRSEFPFKASFSARSCAELIGKLDSALAASADGNTKQSWSTPSVRVTEELPPRILGIFTGQGAQWPTMGAALYEDSEAFRRSMQELEDSLACLPEPPTWSLIAELLAPTETSRVHEAAISQPLCTALQIALVDLLAASGVKFHAVVGHSSGEIAAVYAAGYIKAYDAIRIAYYRGLHADVASDAKTPGRMMAVGMGFEEARTFCQRDQFVGRIVVAASNSRSNTTISGDTDAIAEAKSLLDSQGIFSRILKVEKAYHSPHMDPCVQPYLDSLRQCNIAIRQPATVGRSDCVWFSSVYGPDGRSIDNPTALQDTYWVENLVHPVLFSQALDRAVMESYCYDLVLEVGPHAALKGPATETLRALTGIDLPYSGVLARGTNDMNAFSDALGFLWSHFQSPSPVVGFQGFRKACVGEERAGQVSLVKGLPRYVWDHEKPLWKESRISRAYRERKDPPHELLGTATSNGNNQEIRWRNIMKLSEMDWLRGHQFQNQVLFPAAGYVSMAIEAALRLAHDGQEDTVQLVELEDLIIHEAITLEDDSAGTDVRFVVRVSERTKTTIIAEYTCYSGGVDASSQDTEKVNFTGRAIVTLGAFAVPDALPAREATRLPMSELDLSRFYSSLEEIGLQYSGKFLVQSASRRLNNATVTVPRLESPLRVHPATLDAAFQGTFAAYCFPADGRLRTTYLPTSIERVRVDVSTQHSARSDRAGEPPLTADCYLRSTSAKTISGDVSLFSGHNHRPEIQIEGLTCSSFEGDLARYDQKIFAQTIWLPDVSTSILPEAPWRPEEKELANIIERVAYFYMRRLRDEISPEEIPSMRGHFQCLMSWVLEHVLPRIEMGQHPRLRAEWKDDTPDMIASWQAKYHGKVDMELISALGEALPAVCRGTLPALQVLMDNDMLNRLYKEGLGFPQANFHLASLVSRFSHRYPHLKVLEIGAGTGGATVGVLKALSPQFKSYTYTDISPGFFKNAQSLFQEHLHKMEFKVLDVEQDPVDQGYEEHSFDLVIASNVLHATKFLAKTLRNCRRLLRPGGQLMLIELTSAEETIRLSFLMSTLPGWWLGRDDGRVHAPTISEAQWSRILAENGFSGVDTARRDYDDCHYNSVMATQAVDDRVAILREPLSIVSNASAPLAGTRASQVLPHMKNLVIVGGKDLATSRLVPNLSNLLRPFASDILVVDSLEHFASHPPAPGVVALCLTDLDEPIWKNMTQVKFKGMKNLFLQSSHLLWVTKGRLADEPYCNMTIGMGRSILLEAPDVSLQFLDVDCLSTTGSEAVTVAEFLLRMVCLSSPGFDDVLWSSEHELCMEEGHIYIPRILPDDDLNDRLNADRRPIVRDFHLSSSCVEVIQQDAQIVLLESEQHASCNGTHAGARRSAACKNRLVRVHASSLFPFTTRDHHSFFICIGSDLDSGDRILFLSPTNASVVCASPGKIILLEWTSEMSDTEAIKELLTHLIAESLTFEIEGSLWVHEADDRLATRLLHCSEGRKNRINLFLSTSVSREDSLRSFIHPRTPARDLVNRLPAGALRFVNADHKNNMRVFEDILGSSYRDEDADVQKIFRRVRGRQTVMLQFPLHEIRDRLSEICRHVSSKHALDRGDILSTGITSIAKVRGLSCANNESPTHVVAWKCQEDTVSALVRSLEEVPSLFSSDKTYLLVGLTGEVGMSLCNWMINHGARHLVITSRNPKIHPSWTQHLGRSGARLKVFSLDVSDRKALAQVHSEICDTMPPIAGVANAAMVLSDKAFENTTLDNFNVVLAAKVQGSKNLDDLFFSTELDFFILFSSIASVVGSKGQSNYGAANLFMHSLARQRRNRGVAASVMDIAILLGVGYVSRSLDQYESSVKLYSYMAVSEPLFHNIFAAAILSGKPGSSHPPELITGLGPDADAPWTKRDPRFSHYVLHEQKSNEVAQSVESSGSVLSQLALSTDSTEALSILERSFSKKIELILQLSAESLNAQEPLVQVGIDSLIAVELRSWFLKELKIDMPALKFLNGASVSDLCKDALARLSASPRAEEAGHSLSGLKGDYLINSETSSPDAVESESGGAYTPYSSSESVFDFPTQSAPDLLPHTGTAAPLANNNEHRCIAAEPSPYQRVGPMSFGQARLFFLQEYSQRKSAYTVVMLGKLQNAVDLTKFQKALDDAARKHENLRSAFFIDKSSGDFVQAVKATSAISFQHKVINGPKDIVAEVEAHRNFEFDLAQGQTMKFMVLSESPSVQHLLICYNHIALDGFSSVLLFKDLDEAYSGGTLVPPAQQAIDLSVKQRLNRVPGNLQDELQFWANAFSRPLDPLPLMSLSKVRNRQIMRSFDIVWHDVLFDVQLTRRVKALSARLDVTPFHVYLSTLAAFLCHCFEVDDFSIGIMDSNRVDAEDLATVGYFMNTLPLRFAVRPKSSFESLVRQTRDMAYAALANSRAPLPAIIDHLNVSRSADHHPLFQATLNYRLDNSTRARFGDVPIEWAEGTTPGYPYDLKVDVNDTPEGTRLCFITQKYLYGQSDAKRMLQWYHRALTEFLSDPNIPIASCKLSDHQDEANAIALGRGPRAPVEWHNTLAHRTQEMAILYPDSVAVKDGTGNHLTYSEMMARSEQIAAALQSTGDGAQPGSRVAVLLTATPDVVCSLIAIMRLGLVYVPMDTRNPIERLDAIVSDCEPSAILCHDATESQATLLAAGRIATMNLENPGYHTSLASARENAVIHATPDQIGFVVYTSGNTTGRPKGVLLTHLAVMNQIWGISSQFGIGREIVLQQSSLGFDLALEQIFVSLANGGTLVMVPQDARGDGAKIANIMLAEGITYTVSVPSEYLSIFQYGHSVLKKSSSWRFAFSGREKATARLRRAFRDLELPNLELINLYGPVEASLSCSRGRVDYKGCAGDASDDGSEGFSGHVVPNYSLVIVDQDLHPLPVGYPGEICIAGIGLAVGYLDRRDEDAKRFVDNPFASSDDISRGWTKLYRSGDKGRILEDGSVHFIGRLDGDRQTRIRDIRVDLDEIADVVIREASPVILDAAVSWREDSRVLVAFVTLANEFSGDTNRFLRQLKTSLPLSTYMIPDLILPTESIPKTLNGTKDRSAIDKLPLPEPIPDTSVMTATFSPLELRVKGIWEKVLSTDRVSSLTPESDFFQAGGNSLLLIRLQSALQDVFGCRLTIPELFQFSSIRSMTSRIQATETNAEGRA